jgi:hypothetical protein
MVRSSEGEVSEDRRLTGSIKGISAIGPRGFGCFWSRCTAQRDATNAQIAVRHLLRLRGADSFEALSDVDMSDLFHAHSSHELPANATTRPNGNPLGPNSLLNSSDKLNPFLAFLEVIRGIIDGMTANEKAIVLALTVTLSGWGAGRRGRPSEAIHLIVSFLSHLFNGHAILQEVVEEVKVRNVSRPAPGYDI